MADYVFTQNGDNNVQIGTDRLTGDFKGASMFATVEQARQYNRLRQYEDTGLTPDEIAALRAENERLNGVLKMLVADETAYQDGLILCDADRVKEIERLTSELDAYKADIEAGRLVRFEDGEPYWYCPHCREEVGAYSVTYGELHDRCGHPVEWIKPVKRAALEGGQR